MRREAPKVGRNDPCPCGSGRKFKHCHGAGPQPAVVALRCGCSSCPTCISKPSSSTPSRRPAPSCWSSPATSTATWARARALSRLAAAGASSSPATTSSTAATSTRRLAGAARALRGARHHDARAREPGRRRRPTAARIRFVGTTRWCDFDLFGAAGRAKAMRAGGYFMTLMQATRGGAAVRRRGDARRGAGLPRLARGRADAAGAATGTRTVVITHFAPSLQQRRPALRRAQRHRELLQRRRRPAAARRPVDARPPALPARLPRARAPAARRGSSATRAATSGAARPKGTRPC